MQQQIETLNPDWIQHDIDQQKRPSEYIHKCEGFHNRVGQDARRYTPRQLLELWQPNKTLLQKVNEYNKAISNQ